MIEKQKGKSLRLLISKAIPPLFFHEINIQLIAEWEMLIMNRIKKNQYTKINFFSLTNNITKPFYFF